MLRNYLTYCAIKQNINTGFGQQMKFKRAKAFSGAAMEILKPCKRDYIDDTKTVD